MARQGSQNGRSNNPAGFATHKRQIYTRFYRDAKKMWDLKGEKALKQMAEKNPSGFCQMFASMMPKQFDVTQEVNVTERKSVDIKLVMDELAQIAERLGIGEINQLPHTRVIEHDKRSIEGDSSPDIGKLPRENMEAS